MRCAYCRVLSALGQKPVAKESKSRIKSATAAMQKAIWLPEVTTFVKFDNFLKVVTSGLKRWIWGKIAKKAVTSGHQTNFKKY